MRPDELVALAVTPVVQVMERRVLVMTPGTPARVAARALANAGRCHALLVDDGRLLGVIGEEDLALMTGTAPVGSQVAGPPTCIEATASVVEAATIIVEQDLCCLPVVSDDRVVGVISAADIREAAGLGGEDAGAAPPPAELN